MRSCRFTERDYKYVDNKRVLVPTTSTGNFIGWGIDFYEFESSGAEFTAGIIELADGKVKLIRADDIQFTDGPPSMAKEPSAPEKAIEARLTDS